MMKSLFFKLGFVLLVLSVIGCAGSTRPDAIEVNPRTQAKTTLVDQYQIGVDDQIQISVWKNPDLSITVPVRPDGKISMPLVGEVMAGGKTPEMVAVDITEKLSSYIRDPQVAVILVDLRSHEFLSRVRVSGAVRAPVSVPFRQGMTVLDLVLAAGGMNEFASGNNAKLYRQATDGVQTYSIYLNDILNKGGMNTNLQIQPGDILTVPERIF